MIESVSMRERVGVNLITYATGAIVGADFAVTATINAVTATDVDIAATIVAAMTTSMTITTTFTVGVPF
jgi:hypothetical protein